MILIAPFLCVSRSTPGLVKLGLINSFYHSITVGGCASQCTHCSTKEFIAAQKRRASSFAAPAISSLRKRNSVAAKDFSSSQQQNYLTLPNPQQQTAFSKNQKDKQQVVMGIKLYSVSDSPPTIAVRMGLKYLGIEPELINIDYGNGEQVSEEFRKVRIALHKANFCKLLANICYCFGLQLQL